jgi:shikimate kinase
MMGSGKTTVGQLLAHHKGYTFYDIDLLIEQKEELSISEIFERKGESNFRQMEANMLRENSYIQPSVIATGGGLSCFHNNMEYMRLNGCVIYLRCSPEIILSRLEGDITRPILQNVSTEDKLSKIMSLVQTREDYYSKADVIIDANQEKVKITTKLEKFI